MHCQSVVCQNSIARILYAKIPLLEFHMPIVLYAEIPIAEILFSPINGLGLNRDEQG